MIDGGGGGSQVIQKEKGARSRPTWTHLILLKNGPHVKKSEAAGGGAAACCVWVWWMLGLSVAASSPLLGVASGRCLCVGCGRWCVSLCRAAAAAVFGVAAVLLWECT